MRLSRSRRDDGHIPPPLLEDNEREEMEGWGQSNPEALPGDEMHHDGAMKMIMGVGIHNG